MSEDDLLMILVCLLGMISFAVGFTLINTNRNSKLNDSFERASKKD